MNTFTSSISKYLFCHTKIDHVDWNPLCKFNYTEDFEKEKSIKAYKLSKIFHHNTLSYSFLNSVTLNQGMNAILETQRGISILPSNFIRPLW